MSYESLGEEMEAMARIKADRDRIPADVRRYSEALARTTTADLAAADAALLRILRAVAESAERYGHLDLEERESEHGLLSNEVIREAVRARKALGVE